MEVESDPVRLITINRPLMEQVSFEETYDIDSDCDPGERDKSSSAIGELKRWCLSSYRSVRCASKRHLYEKLLGYVPVIDHLRTYEWKRWIVSDVMAGLSCGVIHVPQGLGFALLAGLPPVYGLYTSFFPGLLYYLVGTSRHISFGTMPVTALMVGAVVNREYALLRPQSSSVTTVSVGTDHRNWLTTMATFSFYSLQTYDNDSLSNFKSNQTKGSTDDNEAVRKVEIAMSVTLVSGLVQLLMWLLGLGSLTIYMSMPFVSSFMVGSAVQIIVIQIPFLLGISITRPPELFQLPLTVYEVFRNIRSTNFCSLVTSVISVTFLVGMKEGVNERFRSRLKFPVPAELIVVVIATIISHLAKLAERFDLSVVGDIQTGFPAPKPPSLVGFLVYIVDGIVIAVVGFAIAVTMAQLMARRNGYEISTNQETFAYGVVNTVAPFFGCFASTQALPRTMVHEAVGCKTQLAGFVSILLPLLSVVCMGPVFRPLPKSVLGSIVACSLIVLLKKFSEVGALLKINRIDFVGWIVTFLLTSMVSVTVGLLVGVALNVFLLVLHAQLAKGHRTVAAGDTELYYQPTDAIVSPSGKAGEKKSNSSSDVFVFRFDCGQICFVNANRFKLQLFKKTIDPTRLNKLTGSDEEEKTHGGPKETPLNEDMTGSGKLPENTDDASCSAFFKDSESSHSGNRTGVSIPLSDGFEGTTEDGLQISVDLRCQHHHNHHVTVTVPEARGIVGEVETKNFGDDIIVGRGRNHVTVPEARGIVGEVETKKHGGDDVVGRRRIIIDCSTVSYIDFTGLTIVGQIYADYKSKNVDLVLANCKNDLRRKFKEVGLIGGKTTTGSNMRVYPSVHDAVVDWKSTRSK